MSGLTGVSQERYLSGGTYHDPDTICRLFMNDVHTPLIVKMKTLIDPQKVSKYTTSSTYYFDPVLQKTPVSNHKNI